MISGHYRVVFRKRLVKAFLVLTFPSLFMLPYVYLFKLCKLFFCFFVLFNKALRKRSSVCETLQRHGWAPLLKYSTEII